MRAAIPKQKTTASQSSAARQKLRRPAFPPPPNAQTKYMIKPINGRPRMNKVINHSPVVSGFSEISLSAMMEIVETRECLFFLLETIAKIGPFHPHFKMDSRSCLHINRV